jgi:hypothetical protein
VPWPHGLADLHSDAPCRLVGDSDRALDLLRRYALLTFDHQPDGNEPLTEWGSGAVEDRPGGDGELMAAGRALP